VAAGAAVPGAAVPGKGAGVCAHAAIDVCKTLTSVRLATAEGTRRSKGKDMWC